ncbi:MAG: guanosine monophosphate reductase [Holophaga sp.]|nr:guanosine monophosphate reductase [Holophaga sp.]
MPETAITFDDVLLIPAYNHHESRRIVDIGMTDKSGKLTLGLPIMTANMDTVTEDAMADFVGERGGIGVLHRFTSIEENVAMFKRCHYATFVSVGTAEAEMERVQALRDAGAQYFCVDVAHGHAKYVGKMIKRMRQMLPNECIMAGNVATYAGADYLASVHADIVKVGIGPGSVCTTRIKTGFGVPQLTAIQECARADRSIVADGGIRTPGDIVKALAFGADFVMVGGVLAGTRPTPGEPLRDADGRPTHKVYRGMASKEVADDHLGGLTGWKTAEGVATKVPYREDEEEILADIIGGLRSGLTYAGANTIRELQRKLNYVLVSPAGRIESLPHKILG